MMGASLFGATYTEHYTVLQDKNVTQNDNRFMECDFEKIIRFDPIVMDSDDNTTRSKRLDEIASEIEKYLQENKKIKVKIIGHTNRADDDPNELRIASKAYGRKIEAFFDRKPQTTQETMRRSEKYACEICDALKKRGIDEKILYSEARGGLDSAYTDVDFQGRKLQERVAVTIYVLKPIEKDSDNDGVFDKKDKCPNTFPNIKVDTNGCPLDNDQDGVPNYQDKCMETPEGTSVDSDGCAIDTDMDGVADYKDACPNTPQNVQVDPNGCPLKQTLALYFKRGSAKILTESAPVIKKFADFLKKNKAYKVEIIGHTDSRGKAEMNMILSQKRAEATKKALVEEGVDPSRITTKGRGELEPIASNRTKEGRAKNRRIEVVLSY